MTTKFRYKVYAQVHFTQEDVKKLMELSNAHYDYHCRDVSRYGGFLYGLDNSVRFSDSGSDDWDVSSSELDTLCKILEGLSREDYENFKPLREKLWQAFKDVGAETRRLHGE